jgi:hypothetical protein
MAATIGLNNALRAHSLTALLSIAGNMRNKGGWLWRQYSYEAPLFAPGFLRRGLARFEYGVVGLR